MSRALEREVFLLEPYQLIDDRENNRFSHTLKGHVELLLGKLCYGIPDIPVSLAIVFLIQCEFPLILSLTSLIFCDAVSKIFLSLPRQSLSVPRPWKCLIASQTVLLGIQRRLMMDCQLYSCLRRAMKEVGSNGTMPFSSKSTD
ncbi:unnamed protein product [Caenorhabditis nigoni]